MTHNMTDDTTNYMTDDGQVPCGRCGGSGSQRSLDSYEEARGIEDPCYHCSNTGWVDAETAVHDAMEGVAFRLASAHVDALGAPEDGWDCYAAEHGMSAWDYKHGLVYEYAYEFSARLAAMTREEQKYMLCLLTGGAS